MHLDKLQSFPSLHCGSSYLRGFLGEMNENIYIMLRIELGAEYLLNK